MKNSNKMIVELTILSVKEYVGQVEYKFTHTDGSISKGIEDDVYITPLVNYEINKGNIILGKTYTSRNDSDSMVENPLKLIRTVDSKRKLMYALRHVRAKSTRFVDVTDPNGNVAKKPIHSYWPKSMFLRYVDNYDNKMKQLDKAEKEKAITSVA